MIIRFLKLTPVAGRKTRIRTSPISEGVIEVSPSVTIELTKSSNRDSKHSRNSQALAIQFRTNLMTAHSLHLAGFLIDMFHTKLDSMAGVDLTISFDVEAIRLKILIWS